MTSEGTYFGGTYGLEDFGGILRMTMRFTNAITTAQFIDLCKQKGYRGTTKLEGTMYKVRVEVPKKEQPGFIAQWASMTMIGPKYKESNTMARTLTETDPMPFGKYGPKGKEPKPIGKVPADYLLFLWEHPNGPQFYQKEPGTNGVADYIRTNFNAIELDAPDFIVGHKPDVPRRPAQ